ncbi:AGAP002891-PB-like protein [Anopheles sinensis]|uniref:AGAP002891-PB-like protein n=1 Tax=Anopheles sinensis TaxID=74873 RepID=A0A084VT38_ANOSI|nr:AGAP002891-PB-like protein [Anopheles sinensis]
MGRTETLSKERTRRHHPLLWDSQYSTVEVTFEPANRFLLMRSDVSSAEAANRRETMIVPLPASQDDHPDVVFVTVSTIQL